MTTKKAIEAIERFGILLVYPVNNKKEPPSLWSFFHPDRKMLWKWDSTSHQGIADLWHLREELARSGRVVYAKWYQGRATFFSPLLFAAIFCLMNRPDASPLSRDATVLLDMLDENSPKSTKGLKADAKREAGIENKALERALKDLWTRLQIVGFGEVDDGAFPSLAVGSTRVLFEKLWNDAKALSPLRARQVLADFRMEPPSAFHRFFSRVAPRFEPSTPKDTRITFEELTSK